MKTQPINHWRTNRIVNKVEDYMRGLRLGREGASLATTMELFFPDTVRGWKDGRAQVPHTGTDRRSNLGV